MFFFTYIFVFGKYKIIIHSLLSERDPLDPPSAYSSSILESIFSILFLENSINTNYYILYMTYYNNWPLLKIKSASQSHNISDFLYLKWSKSNSFSNTNLAAVLICDTTIYKMLQPSPLRPQLRD
jgi:hypothetical protein